jgi:hypothetical protein
MAVGQLRVTGTWDLGRGFAATAAAGGGTTEFRGHPSGRPRLSGTPVPDETVPAWCHSAGCGAVASPQSFCSTGTVHYRTHFSAFTRTAAALENMFD